MFANRFTVFVDACSLVGVLERNLLLSLAQAEFFRVRWSAQVLDETERALERMFAERGVEDPPAKAASSRRAMTQAFEDAEVTGYENIIGTLEGLPDPGDAHVIAAAVKTRASVIVTQNLKHFPSHILAPLDLEAKTADAFIADTIDLDAGLSVAAIRQMRQRFGKPSKTAEVLLLDMEAKGLTQTVDILREHLLSL